MDEAFQLTMPVWEIVVGASVAYLALVAFVPVGAIAADGQISVAKTDGGKAPTQGCRQNHLKEHGTYCESGARRRFSTAGAAGGFI